MRTVLLTLSACVAVFSSLSVAGVAHARADVGVPDPDSLDPPTQYVYSDAIVDHVMVPVPPTVVDAIPPNTAPSVDYIWVDYIRPNTSTTGEKVPTIMDASPYFNTLGRGYKEEYKLPFDNTLNTTAGTDVSPNKALCEQPSGVCPSVAFPEFYDEYFVPRGYAVALMDLRGTRNSTGCNVYGDKQEALDAIAVVDWIASQPWSNGKVGMIGGSYDGTIANGAAALYPSMGTHHNPDALAAIVPVRAIDRWYDYQFFNGVEANGQELDPAFFTQVFPADDVPNSGPPSDPNYAAAAAQRASCPAVSGIPTDAGYASPYQDTNDAGTTNFWNSRDFLQYAPTWHAATFFVHGLYDFNVKTMNSGQLWQALPASVPKRLWYFNGDHDDPDTPNAAAAATNGYLMPFQFQQLYETEVHRWFLQFLKGVDAGALNVPAVQTQRDDGHWDSYSHYPADPTYSSDRILHFTPTNTATDAAAPAGSVQWDDSATGGQAAASQSFLSDPVAVDTRLSGQFEFDLNVSVAGPDTTVAAEIDDVPPGATGFTNEDESTNTQAFAFNYAYIRPFYRASINPRGTSYPTGGSFLTPDQQLSFSFPSTYMDYVVRAGHRLRFTLSDASPYSIATDQGNVVTMFTGATGGLSQVRVPLASIVELPVVTPDLPGGIFVGGPATAGLLGAAAWMAAARRRRRADKSAA